MNPEVLTVREDMSVRALASFLVDNEITGAPVEDVSGKLVGVVSLVDIASVASDSGGVASDQSNPDFFVRGWEDKIDFEEMIEFRVDNENLKVGEIMTPTIYSVSEDTTVSDVATTMLNGHLHRLLVTRDEKPVGIVSTSDLLVEHNDFRGNTYGIRYESRGSETTIAGNDISGNEYAFFPVVRNTSEVKIVNNAIASTGYNVKMGQQQSEALDFRSNWWGSARPAVIEEGFFDGRKDGTLGRVLYEPFLTAPPEGAGRR